MLSRGNGIFRFWFSELNLVVVDFSDTSVQTHKNAQHRTLGYRNLNTNSRKHFGFYAVAYALYIVHKAHMRFAGTYCAELLYLKVGTYIKTEL
jgi:hypothetical protein